MRRKIIQLSTNTNVISLPAKWVRRNNLSKGDELELEMTDSSLYVFTTRKPKKITTVIKIGNDDTLVVWEAVDTAYIKGSDEIMIKYSDPKLLEHIHKVSMRMLGMAVTEERKNLCVMKDVGGQNQEDFDVILKRIFLLIKTVAEEGYAAAAQGDFDTLVSMKYRDYNINSFSSYCLRSLNKYGNKDDSRAQKLYLIVKQLETIGDKYRDLCRYLGKEKIRLGKNSLAYFTAVNDCYETFYKLFYKFNWDEAKDMIKIRKNMFPEVSSLLKNCKPTEIIALHYLWEIISLLFDSYETLLVMEI